MAAQNWCICVHAVDGEQELVSKGDWVVGLRVAPEAGELVVDLAHVLHGFAVAGGCGVGELGLRRQRRRRGERRSMTFVRIWRARVDLERLDDYLRFVDEQSLPMFQGQQGFLGVICSRLGDEVAVLSFWRDEAAVDALDTSATYQHAVRTIGETGFLIGDSVLDVFEVHAGVLHSASGLLAQDGR
jgi:heme-degrading monooxygenase HmoA